jgi:peptidoglycan/LPS O-acetylase OafA/YrhL
MGTLRFLLALCVVATHSPGSRILGHELLSGITAVQAFYVISGFLITMVLNERQQYRNATSFYVSRYLRLWPAYIVVVAATLAILHARQLHELALMRPSTIMFIGFSNLSLFFQDWFFLLRFDAGYLVPTAHWTADPAPHPPEFLIVPQSWTIGVELTFYLIAPFTCRSVRGTAALFLFGLATRLCLGAFVMPGLDPWFYRFAPAEMMLFASGGLGYFAGRAIRKRVPPESFTMSGGIAFAILAVVIVANPTALGWWLRIFPGYMESLYLGNAAILLAVALASPHLFYAFRNVRFDSFLGELSYPMYLSHLLVGGILLRLHLPAWLIYGNLCYVGATLVASTLLVMFIVIPVDRWRSRFGARVPTISMAGREPSENANGSAVPQTPAAQPGYARR